MAATATTTAVIEAVEKEVAMGGGWLNSSMPNARNEGGIICQRPLVVVAACSYPGHILGCIGKIPMRM